VLFVGVITIAAREIWRHAAADRLTAICGAGIVAFLLTCVTGHPLLTPDAAYPFWMALAVVTSPWTMPPAHRSRSWLRLAAVAAVLAIAVTLPMRAADAVGHARLGNTVVGLSSWQRDPSGESFRWAAAQSTFFYASGGRAVRIPIRPGPDAPPEMEVRVAFDGQEADRVRLRAGEAWRYLRLVRSRKAGDADYFRIDLTATAVDGGGPLDTGRPRILMIGMPAILWGQ